MPKNKEGRKIYDCQRPNALPHSVRYAAPIDGQEPLAGGSSAVFSAHAEVVPFFPSARTRKSRILRACGGHLLIMAH